MVNSKNTSRFANKNIVNNLEAQADYYPPATYGLGFGQNNVGQDLPGLLSFYQSLSLEADSATDQFIPLSSVAQRGRNPKLFAVGIMPPIQNVTGRILDRSATTPLIESLNKQGNTDDPNGDAYIATGVPGGIVTAPGYQLENTNASGSFSQIPSPGNAATKCQNGELAWSRIRQEDGSTPMRANGKVDSRGVSTANCSSFYSPAQLYRVLGDAYVRVHGVEPTPVELQLYTAQSLRETSGFLASNNFGQIGNRSSPSGRPEYSVQYTPGKDPEVVKTAYFNSYDTLDEGAEAYIRLITTKNENVRQAARSGDVLGYTTSLAQQGYFQEPVTKYYNNVPRFMDQVAASTAKHGITLPKGEVPNTAPDLPGFKENGFEYQDRVKNLNLTGRAALFRFNEGSPYEAGDLPSMDQPSGTDPSWKVDGSRAAQRASKEQADNADIDITYTEEGRKLIAKQREVALATKAALENMASAPPLRFLVNPNKFNVKAQKIVSDGNWTRNGPIIEFWGDDQDKISGSGQVAAFYAIDAKPPNVRGGGPGITRTARNASQAYQNFQSLWLIYKNNGGMYLPSDFSQQDRDITLTTVGSVYIYYDNILYLGSFDSFNVTEDDTKPFTLEYDFEFTVRAAFLLEHPSDYNYNTQTPDLKRRLTETPSLPTRSSRLAPTPASQDPVVREGLAKLVSENSQPPPAPIDPATVEKLRSSIEEAR